VANNKTNGLGSADIFILLNHKVINDMLLFCHTANTCHVESFHDKRIYLTPKENEFPATWRGRCMLTALQRLHPTGRPSGTCDWRCCWQCFVVTHRSLLISFVWVDWLEMIEKVLDVGENEFSKKVFLATMQARQKKNVASNSVPVKQRRASELLT